MTLPTSVLSPISCLSSLAIGFSIDRWCLWEPVYSTTTLHQATGQGPLEYKHSNASILSLIIKGIKLDKEITTVSRGTGTECTRFIMLLIMTYNILKTYRCIFYRVCHFIFWKHGWQQLTQTAEWDPWTRRKSWTLTGTGTNGLQVGSCGETLQSTIVWTALWAPCKMEVPFTTRASPSFTLAGDRDPQHPLPGEVEQYLPDLQIQLTSSLSY